MILAYLFVAFMPLAVFAGPVNGLFVYLFHPGGWVALCSAIALGIAFRNALRGKKDIVPIVLLISGSALLFVSIVFPHDRPFYTRLINLFFFQSPAASYDFDGYDYDNPFVPNLVNPAPPAIVAVFSILTGFALRHASSIKKFGKYL